MVLASPGLLGRVTDFERAQQWYEVGVQVLLTTRWWPDCAKRTVQDERRMAPPGIRREVPLAFGGPQSMQWFDDPELDIWGLSGEKERQGAVGRGAEMLAG